MRVLVMVAHPDDEVLGCGATIVKLARGGHEVSVVIIGEGLAARYSDRNLVAKDLFEQLHDQSQRVSQLLLVKNLVMLNYPYSQLLDTLPFLDIVKQVEAQIEQFKPNIIYTYHGSDLNLDHQIVHRAVMTATRPIGEAALIEAVYAFEILSSTEWAFSQNYPCFQPNVFEGVADTLELKIQAMRIYTSEVRTFPHPRSPEALRANAQKWGSTVGLDAAEAFQLVRSIRV